MKNICYDSDAQILISILSIFLSLMFLSITFIRKKNHSPPTHKSLAFVFMFFYYILLWVTIFYISNIIMKNFTQNMCIIKNLSAIQYVSIVFSVFYFYKELRTDRRGNKNNYIVNNSRYPYIFAENMPTIPVSMPHSMFGEIWLCDEYLIQIQELPKSWLEINTNKPFPIKYLFTASVFWRIAKKKDALITPILIITLEQEDKNHTEVKLQVEKMPFVDINNLPVTIGVFFNNNRENHGLVRSNVNINDARLIFFDIIKNKLKTISNPIFAGNLQEIVKKSN